MSIVKFTDLVKPPRHLSTQAFMLRLTSAERIAIRNAANSVPDVQDWLFILEKGKYVDLDRKDLHTGLNAMVAFGLLSAGRVAQILSDPIMDGERY
jgi:hypothetical protein